MQSPSPESTTERWWLGAALALAPASYLAAQGVLAAMPREGSLFATLAAHSGLWLASHVLLTAWLVLLVPSLAALGTLLGRDGWPYRVIGVTLAALGLVVNGLITGVDFVLGAIAPLDATLTARVHETISATVLAPLDLLDTALPLGLLVLTLGLFRRRTAPLWAVLLLLAALAVPNTPELALPRRQCSCSPSSVSPSSSPGNGVNLRQYPPPSHIPWLVSFSLSRSCCPARSSRSSASGSPCSWCSRWVWERRGTGAPAEAFRWNRRPRRRNGTPTNSRASSAGPGGSQTFDAEKRQSLGYPWSTTTAPRFRWLSTRRCASVILSSG